jgi:hypothetical protein
MAKIRDTNRKKAVETRRSGKDNRETAIALRLAGSSYAEISRELNIHASTAKSWCAELDEPEPVNDIIKTRRKIVQEALRKTLKAFNPDPKNTTLQGLVSLLNYADKIEGVDRCLANLAGVDQDSLPPILRIELAHGSLGDIVLDKPEDFDLE